jgi:hypothetical protein
MSVKVKKAQPAQSNEKPFPKLMISGNGKKFVFFLEPKIGFQLNHDDGNTTYPNPHYDINWDMDKFTDYNHPITLQND